MRPCAATRASTRRALDEVTSKVRETLVPSLSELPGFSGYYLIDAGEGVFASIGLFDEAKTAHESTRIAARWVREQKLESALPNTPTIIAGPVVVHESHGRRRHERRPGARLALEGERGATHRPS